MLVILALLLSAIFVAYGQHREVSEWYDRVNTWDQKNVIEHVIPVLKPDYSYMVQIEAPRSGDIVGHTFLVQGVAHPAWYANGEFALEIQTPHGVVIESYMVAGAQNSDEDAYVPFSLSISAPYYTGPAKVVFKKANPYHVPEYDWAEEVSIVIQ